jgi:hypothetical protein
MTSAMQDGSERVDYYPVKVAPNKPVWEVDYHVRRLAGLPSIHPPTDYRWRKTPKGRKVERPVAIIHRTCYFGFRKGLGPEDYQRMLKVSDYFHFGLAVLGMDRGQPYALKPAEIARLKLLDKEGVRRTLTEVHKSLRAGEAIRISGEYKEGALTDWSGLLLGFDGEWAKVQGVMLGAVRDMSVPAWAVERA